MKQREANAATNNNFFEIIRGQKVKQLAVNRWRCKLFFFLNMCQTRPLFRPFLITMTYIEQKLTKKRRWYYLDHGMVGTDESIEL